MLPSRHRARPGTRLMPELRPLEPRDWPSIREIYLEGLATGHATLETQAPSWEQWEAGHCPSPRLVVVEDERILGWATLSPVSRREVYRGVAEVSIYVSAAARGRGIGLQLLQALVEASEREGFWTLQASILAENTPSLALHQKLGFRIVGRRERIGRRDGTWRDTVLLERRSNKVGTD